MIEHFNQRLQRHLIERPEADAVVSGQQRLSYAELAARVAQGAQYLHGHGIAAGSVVALAIKDEVEHLLASITLLLMGARQITIASHDTPSMQASLMSRVGATFMVSDHALLHGHIPVVSWAGMHQQATQCMPDLQAPGSGDLFLRTSGTTGLTNIVAFSDAQLSHQSSRHHEYASERLLRLASIEHNNSKRHRLYCFWQGGVNVFLDSAGSDLFDYLAQTQVSCLDISRLHAVGIYKAAHAKPLPEVKVRTGGSAIPYAVRANILQHLTDQLYVRYATTETGSITMALPGEHAENESSGRPLSGVVIGIFDAGGKQLPPGEAGEIGVQCPGMATSYVDNPAQSAQRFKDGWFYPGDVGQLLPDGQLRIFGRSDEMIVLNGLNIFPKEIEDVLEAHPDVVESAAIALPSRHHGDIPVAAVSIREGAQLNAAELLAYCKPHLGMKAPRKIVVLPQLPRNSQGKILKRDLPPFFNPQLGNVTGHEP